MSAVPTRGRIRGAVDGEPVAPRAVVLVFARGQVVECHGARFGGPQRALIEAVERRGSHLMLSLPEGSAIPGVGERMELRARRLDGVYCLPVLVARALEEAPNDAPQGAHAPLRLRVQPVMSLAVRQQRRAFYRLPGHWPARIERLPGETPAPRAPAPRPVTVRDLSAGGMLLEEGLDRCLGPGVRFKVALQLDETEPLVAQAQVVRRQATADGTAAQWGCRFETLAVDDQTRILTHLHALCRQRQTSGVA